MKKYSTESKCWELLCKDHCSFLLIKKEHLTPKIRLELMKRTPLLLEELENPIDEEYITFFRHLTIEDEHEVIADDFTALDNIKGDAKIVGENLYVEKNHYSYRQYRQMNRLGDSNVIGTIYQILESLEF